MLELTVDRISKQYGRKLAVDGFSHTFTHGVYGLLGANGAGKTTLLRMLCGILTPSAGEIRCNNSLIENLGGEYRRRLGYLPQDFGYYPEFTAKRFLMYLAALKAVPRESARIRVEELLELVDLKQDQNRRIKTFSGGMVRRLGIAQAMLGDPEILILDEPTAGLDPKERIRFRNIISSFARDRVILLSTHIVSDVEYIADEILLMKGGKLIGSGQDKELLALVKGKVWELEVESGQAEKYRSRYPVSNLRNTQGGVQLRILSEEKPGEGAFPAEGNLEDVYLYYFAEERERLCQRTE